MAEKKHLTLNVDSEIANKAVADPNINVSEITEKFLRAFTSSSETSDKEELYKKYQELFKLMSRLLRKFHVKTQIGKEVVFNEPQDREEADEYLEPVYGNEGEVIGVESQKPSDIYYFYLEPDGSFSHTNYEIKDIKKIPIEAFYRPKDITDKFLEAIQEGVEYHKEQFREIEMAKTIIDAITKGTIPKSKKSKGRKRR